MTDIQRRILLLHGFTGSPASFNPLLPYLAGADVATQLIAPPLLGHSSARLPTVERFEDEVDRIAELIGDLAVEVIAYSMGARLALGLAVRHPERIARLVLIGAHPGLPEENGRRDRKFADAEWINRLLTEGIQSFVDAWELLPMWDSQRSLPPEVLGAQREIRLGHRAEGLANALKVLGLAQMPDYAPALPRLIMPVLVVAGSRDAKFSALGARMAAAIPQGRLALVDSAGHNVILERPDEVARLVLARSESAEEEQPTDEKPEQEQSIEDQLQSLERDVDPFEDGESAPLRAWILASRPATLSAGAIPVLLGTACAIHAESLRLGPALAALAGALLIQIGTNLANDVLDFEKGADTHERIGPVRAAQAGLLSPGALRLGMVVAFGMATAVGLYLVTVGGWPIVAIGVASIAAGIAYTGGPYPLGYHGLGDLFVMAFFGFVAVCGTAYVQVGTVPMLAWWISVPVGALSTAILVVNNIRDRDTDRRAGKRTLAVRFGRRAGLAEYSLLLASAYLVPIALVATDAVAPWALLPLATLPIALSLTKRLFAIADGPALNGVLAGTARLLLLHGLLLAGGICVPSWIS